MSKVKTDNSSDPLPSGDIRFYDNYEAPLEAGDYTIAVTQHVESTSDGVAPNGQPINENFPATGQVTQAFTVVAPRFTLDPADIYSTFPPNAASGTFDQNLPHIVLTKRGLPWERYLVEGNKITPWLAVLLFSPDEIVQPADAPSANPLANPSRAGTYRLTDVINPPTGTLGPDIVQEFEDQLDQVTALQLVSGGSGYTDAPMVIFTGGGGSGAAATATVQNGAVTQLTLEIGGSGYTSDPTISFSGGGGSGATAQAERGLLCRAIDISPDTFTKVTPRFTNRGANPVDELRFLAHCRQVSTLDKEIQATKDDGWFSVLIGNRFPSPGPSPVVSLTLNEEGENYTSAPDVSISGGGGSGATAIAIVEDGVITGLTLTNGGSDYTSAPTVSFSGGDGSGATTIAQISAPWVAHLVTLEGFEEYLTDSPSWPQGTNLVRLVSLYSWNFNCLSEMGDFRDLMLNLISGQAQGGDCLLLRLPVTSEVQTPGSAAAKVQQALNEGYAALSYDTMVGDHTFAWYRGPLLPAPRPLFQGIQPYASASAAMIYDQTNALFDQSYAAAWQTGRLLALTDASFGTKLMQWRRNGTKQANLLLARLNSPITARALPELAGNFPQSVAQLRSLLKPDLVSGSLIKHLLGAFNEKSAAKMAESVLPARSPEQTTDRRVHAVAPNRVQALKQMYAQPETQQLLTGLDESALEDDPDSPLVYIQKWLAELCLLYGVPFVNLVPDARMLPTESLRLFFVDPNYIEALLNGALSIGIESSRDQLYQSLTQPALKQAAARAMFAVRDLRAGRKLAAAPDLIPPTPTETMAGLLLRSSVVSGWPGLEVRAYSGTEGTNQLKPLRMDRLAPDVLMCLFPSAPARIEISEPKEGLAFGHEDDFDVDLRWVTNNPPNQPIGEIIAGHTVAINNYFRSSDPAPVLRVNDWQLYLQTQLNAAYGNGSITLGPADFAIQMVRAPEEFVLVNTTSDQSGAQ